MPEDSATSVPLIKLDIVAVVLSVLFLTVLPTSAAEKVAVKSLSLLASLCTLYVCPFLLSKMPELKVSSLALT